MKNHPQLLTQNLGVDVSKDLLEVVFSYLDMQQHVKVKACRKFANSPAGFKQLQKWLESKRVEQVELRILMEAGPQMRDLIGRSRYLLRTTCLVSLSAGLSGVCYSAY